MGMNSAMWDVLEEIAKERERQDAKWGVQNRRDGTNDSIYSLKERDNARDVCDKNERQPHRASWLQILREEYLEAGAEVEKDKLRKELIQTAAVCVAWIENIDRGGQPEGGKRLPADYWKKTEEKQE